MIARHELTINLCTFSLTRQLNGSTLERPFSKHLWPSVYIPWTGFACMLALSSPKLRRCSQLNQYMKFCPLQVISLPTTKKKVSYHHRFRDPALKELCKKSKIICFAEIEWVDNRPESDTLYSSWRTPRRQWCCRTQANRKWLTMQASYCFHIPCSEGS